MQDFRVTWLTKRAPSSLEMCLQMPSQSATNITGQVQSAEDHRGRDSIHFTRAPPVSEGTTNHASCRPGAPVVTIPNILLGGGRFGRTLLCHQRMETPKRLPSTVGELHRPLEQTHSCSPSMLSSAEVAHALRHRTIQNVQAPPSPARHPIRAGATPDVPTPYHVAS
jgi:hypothetical protein